MGKKNLSYFSKMMKAVKEKANQKLSKETRMVFNRVYKSFVALTSIVAQGMQIWQAVTYLLNWDNLSPVDRAKGVLQVVEAALQMIGDIVSVYRVIKNYALDDLKLQQTCGKWNLRIGGSKPKAVLKVDAIEEKVLNSEGLAQVNSEAKGAPIETQVGEVTSQATVEEMATRFKASKARAGFLSAVVVLANMAVVVGLWFQIEREWGTEKTGIIVLDIVSMAAVTVQVFVQVSEIGLALMGIERWWFPLLMPSWRSWASS
ncbi:hypothetical protein VTN00DRAFT_7417 [Thermoascus crustaceus]|uniref:uncharacterized protein n=1 Tax=Thermoascus crustaceus TaxID=5088 RepID=UPI00374479CF